MLDPGNPSIAETLNSLAGLYRDERRYKEAEALYRQALPIREKAFGPTGADVAATLRDYADLLRRTGRVAAADSLDARAGRIAKRN